MEMALAVGAGTVFGYLLDRRFDTSPILTLIFMFVGVVGGVVNFIRLWQFLKKKFSS